jgi:hypothetical protein
LQKAKKYRIPLSLSRFCSAIREVCCLHRGGKCPIYLHQVNRNECRTSTSPGWFQPPLRCLSRLDLEIKDSNFRGIRVAARAMLALQGPHCGQEKDPLRKRSSHEESAARICKIQKAKSKRN